MSVITATRERVAVNTPADVNERIRDEMEARVTYLSRRGPEAMRRRLGELEEEWDVERCLETMAPSLTLTGLILGVVSNRKWFAVSLLVQSFFLQHALQGWCPPLPVMRRLGIRTPEEINEERFALKTLLGDFDGARESANGNGKGLSKLFAAVRR